MKAYLSCAKSVESPPRYHLHATPPDWRTPESEVSGCQLAVERVPGDRTPAVGELLELDVRPGKTWVWE